MKIAFLVQGLFEVSDSIGFDCVYQYREVASTFPEIKDVTIFAQRFDSERHRDVPIQGLEAFYEWCDHNPTGLVIYHYCGAWLEIDKFLSQRQAASIIRWHNNTSPWFYFEETNNLSHTLDGFESIVDLARNPNLYFWVNSSFTRDQFVALGGSASRCAVVFPASRYLGKASIADSVVRPERFAPDGPINLLFVGRVVSHKGHRTIIAVAERLKEITGHAVIVRFAGREDRVKQSIIQFAEDAGVETYFYGEVPESTLVELYSISDALVCLSEHEGFGLPVFEAMRCNLPVVAWATTAFRELLADHPLAFRYYDLNMFAAALASLLDPAIHRQVLRTQQRILSIYSGSVVRQQIDDGIFKLTDRTSAISIPGSVDASQESADVVKNTMSSWLMRARNLPNTTTHNLIYDSGTNLVSLYDIKLFRALFDGMKRLRFSPFTSAENNGTLLLEAETFSSHSGALVNGQLVFVEKEYNAGHLIFGPYLALPAGDFVASFDLEINFAPDSTPAPVLIDVCCGPHGVIAKKKIAASRSHDSSEFTVEFSLPVEGSVTEFRVDIQQSFLANIVFRGINLRRQEPSSNKKQGSFNKKTLFPWARSA